MPPAPPPELSPVTMSTMPPMAKSADSHGARRAKRLSGSAAPSWAAAIGGTRVARSAGRSAATSVTTVPTTSAVTTVSPLTEAAGRRQREAERVEDREHAVGDPDAGDQADDRREDADHQCLADHVAHHLAARGAERPDHPELAGALGDGDPEGVEDDEGADEERQHAERRQHRRQEAVDVARDLVRLVLRVLLAGLDLHRVRKDLLQVRLELVGRHALRRRRPPPRDTSPSRSNHFCASRRVVRDEGRAAHRLLVAELEDADDLHRHGADVRGELDAGLADA